MADTDIIPIVLQAPKEEQKPQIIPFQPISKKWKIIIGVVLFFNTLVFLQTAYLYYAFRDTLAFLASAMQASPIGALLGFVGLLVNSTVFFIYFYFHKRQSQTRADIPTSKKWKFFFVLLTIFYLFLAGLLSLIGGLGLGLSVITDSIIAAFNIIILLIYFDRHKPRKLFVIVGNTIIYLSLVLLFVGIILQILSTISFFT